MLMQIKHRVYVIGCPSEIVFSIRETAQNVCDTLECEWIVSDIPKEEMRGYCIILYGPSYVSSVYEWTKDTAILLIAECFDICDLRQGFVDILTLPLDKERFAASFSNMVCRCDLKRRLDVRENELNTYFEISDDMLWSKDLADLHMDVNHILVDLAGKPREQIEGKHENEVYGLEPDAAGCKQSDLIVRTTGKTHYFEESMPGADGMQHHLRVTKAPWLDGQGNIIGSIGLAKDVSDLMNQQAKFQLFLNDLELGVVIVDNENTVIQANRVFLDIVGLPENEIVGYKLKEPECEKTTEFGAKDYIIPAACGGEKIWTCNKFDLKDYWGKRYGYTHVFHDVTLERKQEKEIKMMAQKDQLTGLSNRTGLYQHFRAMDKCGNATFLFIDIDNFKMVNDRFGHHVGDQLLNSVAELFKITLSKAFAARIGGDEFICIIDGSIERPEIEKMASKLLKNVRLLQGYPKEALDTISLSIGILYQHPLRDSLNNIMCMSDEGMYQAKRTGKNKFCFYMETDEQQRA